MILDRNGNPIAGKANKPDKDPQTSAYVSLHRELADHPSRWLTPQKLANYFQNAESGDLVAQNDLAMDMEEKDAHLFAEISKRKRTILNFDWHIKTIGDKVRDQKKAQLIQEFVQYIDDFEDVLLDLMDGVLKGYSCLEIADDVGNTGWELVDNTWLVKSLQFRPQSWFCTNPEHQNQLRLRDNSLYGQELWDLGWIRHIHRSKSGYISRAGLVRVLAWPYLFKNYAIRDFAEFLEIYGIPVRLGKYSINATDREKDTLLKAVVEMGHNAAGIIPESMAIEFLSSANGTPESFQTMIDWAEKSISKAILGGTLTSQADGKTSTNALGTIHEDARFEIAISDAKQIATTLTKQLIHPLCELNGFDSKLFSFEFDTSITNIDEIQKLSQIGLRIPAKYVREKLNIPEPIEDEEVLGGNIQINPKINPIPKSICDEVTDEQDDDLVTQKQTLKSTSATKESESLDTVEKYTTQLDRKMQPILAGWVGQVHAVVEQAKSLEDVRDRIFDLYPQIESKEFATIMQMARMTAELSGRFELNKEVSDV
jgi:phage gp29-like protein